MVVPWLCTLQRRFANRQVTCYFYGTPRQPSAGDHRRRNATPKKVSQAEWARELCGSGRATQIRRPLHRPTGHGTAYLLAESVRFELS
ncbi:hypothetical protein VTN77DRAFT_5188 [Rasamsonia byssochlamydoides]|uniref:uncharacterized protein n=1 Tax=Rasamsonia byssochlamydoides TaxID=89139 RepID=UPI0037435F2D